MSKTCARRGGEQLADALQRQLALVIALGEQHRQDASPSPGKPCEACHSGLSLVAFLRGTWSEATRSIVPSKSASQIASRSSLRAEGRVRLAHAAQISSPPCASGSAGRSRRTRPRSACARSASRRAPGATKCAGSTRARRARSAKYMARSAGSASVMRGLDAAPVLQRVAACRLHLAPLAVDDLDVLGVADDDRPSDARRLLEQVVEVAVVGAVQPEVAAFLALEVHEVLERRDAVVVDVLAELLDMQLVGGAEVEAEVDVARARARSCSSRRKTSPYASLFRK